MNIIEKVDLDLYKTIIENKIKNKLGIKSTCKAVLKSGNRCNNFPVKNENTCKKHEKCTNLIKQKKDIIYHNHLPFEKSNNCPLCIK